MNHCKDVHKDCDETHENLAANSGTDDVSVIYKQWEKEKSAFLKANVVNHYKSAHAWGHFSQIVWAENTEIGCAMAKCSHEDMGGKYNLLVCKYRKGNVIGSKVYEGGHSSNNSSDKKTTSKKSTTSSTTTTTTTRKTTTTTSVVVKPTNSSKVPVQSAKAIGQGTSATTSVATIPFAVSTTLSSVSSTSIASSTAPTIAITQNKNNSNANKENEEATKKDIEIENSKEDNSNASTIATGIAVSGTVIGAVAAFALVKKNPTKYEDFKKNISRKATSVKRGASVVTRKFTTKKPSIPTTAPQNYNYEDYTYKANLDNIMKV